MGQSKRLTKTGNSFAVVLDRPLLEATGITAETPLAISTDGDVIVISPLRDEARAAKLRDGIEEMHRRYSGVFRRLA